ncbi:hypothetical protein ID866_1056 [Astraeus odoratus]|nr:hypothetical protein ID866_1056 [Astraeus odoratus]
MTIFARTSCHGELGYAGVRVNAWNVETTEAWFFGQDSPLGLAKFPRPTTASYCVVADVQPFMAQHGLRQTRAEYHNINPEDGEPVVHLASPSEKKRLWWKNAVINGCFILSWFTFATVLSVYNKWMFSYDHFGFPYPLFVTTVHMFVQFVLAAVLRFIHPRRFRSENKPTVKAYGTKAVPAAVSTSVDIGLSNVSLKTITLSFYTMCKSSSLIFVLIFAFLFRLEKFSLRLVTVILVIFGGVLLMVASETAFVLSGFLLVMTASEHGDGQSCCDHLLAIPDHGFNFGHHYLTSTINTSALITLPGVLAFCMVLSEFYIIQRAGVLPMSIAGIAKEVSTITVSAWFFGDELTPLNITGVAITTCGIALFTYHKYRKTVDSHVALDAHGNPIRVNDDNIVNLDQDLELNVARSHVARPKAQLHGHEVDEMQQHLLFSTEGLNEGEEDAEELASVGSSKVIQSTENDLAGKGQAHEGERPQ